METNYGETKMLTYSEKQIGRLEVIQQKSGSTYVVVEVPSQSNPDKMYRVDLTNGRCSCPAWTFNRDRKPCKHLRALGYKAKEENYASI
jgi:predicted nucleic acid-binding Zn finger protein